MATKPRIKKLADASDAKTLVTKPEPKQRPKAKASQTLATQNTSSGGTGWADEHRGSGGSFVIVDGKRVRAE